MAQNERLDIIGKLGSLPVDQQERLQSDYRSTVARILNLAANFTGNQVDYEFLMNNLRSLERWLQAVFRGDISKRLTTEEERDVGLLFDIANDVTVAGLLDTAATSFKQKVIDLAKTSKRFDAMSQELNIHTVTTTDVLLPPDDGLVKPRRIDANDDEVSKVEIRLQQRLAELLTMLVAEGIYTDDVIIVHGEVSGRMMRDNTYVLVEIPRLKRQILVCDQVGEATFVVQGIFNRSTFTEKGKSEIRQTYPDHIVRVIYRNQSQWQGAIKKVLFTNTSADLPESPNKIGSKIDITAREVLISDICKVYPESKLWYTTALRPRGEIVPGWPIIRLGRTFGVTAALIQGRAIPTLQIGLAIYGDDDTFLSSELARVQKTQRIKAGDAVEKAKFIEEVKQVLPTSKDWLGLWVRGASKKGDIVPGFGMRAFASLFGVEGLPTSSRRPFIQVGLCIYGENDPALAAELAKVLVGEKLVAREVSAVEKLKGALTASYPTPEDWLALWQGNCINGDLVPGFGVKSIATILLPGSAPRARKKDFVLLGMELYGKQAVVLKDELEKIEYLDRLESEDGAIKAKALITLKHDLLTAYPSSEEFIKAFPTSSNLVKGLSTAVIMRIMRLTGASMTEREQFIRLGFELYSDNDVLLHQALLAPALIPGKPRGPAVANVTDATVNKVEVTLDDLRSLIKVSYPQSQDWLGLWQSTGIIFADLGLVGLASRFSIDGNPHQSRKVFLNLGVAIYGETVDLKKALTEIVRIENLVAAKVDLDLQAKVVEDVKKAHPDGASWLKLFGKNGVPVDVIPGVGIIRLASILGFVSAAQPKRETFIIMGLTIYKDDACLKEALAITLKRKAVDVPADASPDVRSQILLPLIAEIKLNYPDSHSWLAVWKNSQAPKGDIVKGFGIKRLGKLFQVHGSPANSRQAYLKLGLAIYGQEDILLIDKLRDFE